MAFSWAIQLVRLFQLQSKKRLQWYRTWKLNPRNARQDDYKVQLLYMAIPPGIRWRYDVSRESGQQDDV